MIRHPPISPLFPSPPLSLSLLLLPQQLRDPEPQLDVVRLARQLVGQGVDRLERVALLLVDVRDVLPRGGIERVALRDRKSTRLNSSHLVISYAVFCLKKKKE